MPRARALGRRPRSRWWCIAPSSLTGALSREAAAASASWARGNSGSSSLTALAIGRLLGAVPGFPSPSDLPASLHHRSASRLPLSRSRPAASALVEVAAHRRSAPPGPGGEAVSSAPGASDLPCQSARHPRGGTPLAVGIDPGAVRSHRSSLLDAAHGQGEQRPGPGRVRRSPGPGTRLAASRTAMSVPSCRWRFIIPVAGRGCGVPATPGARVVMKAADPIEIGVPRPRSAKSATTIVGAGPTPSGAAWRIP